LLAVAVAAGLDNLLAVVAVVLVVYLLELLV
jgi:hypothetical protein